MKTLFFFIFFFFSLWSISFADIGFASKVTGGGNIKPVYPNTPKELASYLEDDEPRVIIISKEFNFLGTMGSVTEKGCRPKSNTCPSIGQDSIGSCEASRTVTVTYDKAAHTALNVKSHKTLKGKGAHAVIKGRGLNLGGSNIIIQNIHFTEINRHLIFGGDAIHLWGGDLIWIDHCKFSHVGRQFLAISNYTGSGTGRITFSYNEFDGKTDHSASCDGHHYWTILFNTHSYRCTFVGNYIHTTSGRGPKLAGGGSFVHAVNNYFSDISGHAFDTHSTNGFALIEGNYFENVATPRMNDDNQQGYAPTELTYDCFSLIGRRCQPNKLTKSGVLKGDTKGLISRLKGLSLVSALEADKAKSFVLKYAGVGKI